jgi:hypothetical protein
LRKGSTSNGLTAAPDEADVYDGRRADELNALVPRWAAAEVIEETLAAAEKDGHDREVHLVD